MTLIKYAMWGGFSGKTTLLVAYVWKGDAAFLKPYGISVRRMIQVVLVPVTFLMCELVEATYRRQIRRM